MMKKPITCTGCPIVDISRSFSIPEGTCKTGVLIIGESLGEREAFDSLPFRPHAEAGSVLQTCIRLLGYDRLDFGLWNLIACQPPYNKLEHAPYEESAILHCRVHFDAVVAKLKPKVILALGNLPLKYLWKRDPRIDEFIDKIISDIEIAKGVADAEVDPDIKLKLKEEVKSLKKTLSRFQSKLLISNMRGYTLPSIYNIPIVPSIHPSFINRSGRVLIGTLMRDLYHALNVAKGKIPKFTTNYIKNPTIAQAKTFYLDCKNHPELPIAHDIETPYTALEVDESEEGFIDANVRNIDSIQFSIRKGEGIYLSWSSDFIHIITDILSLPNVKLGWSNWQFDEINLEYHLGRGCIAGDSIDLRWAWKHLNSDFSKFGGALQFATNFYAPEFPAWKHLAQIESETYGILDVDSCQRIWTGIQKDFEARLFPDTKSLNEGFIDDIVKLRPILVDMQDRGIPIDEVERTKFAKRVDLERNKTLLELQDLFPMSLRRADPKLGYKTLPKEVQILTEEFNSRLDFKGNKDFVLLENPESADMLLHKYIESKTRKEDETGLMVREFAIGDVSEKRYCRLTEFKPSSSQQTINYIKHKINTDSKWKKIKVPKKKNLQGIEVDTSSKDEIHKIWEETNDPLLERIVLFRELNKMQSTYCGGGSRGKEGWKTGIDGRIHTTFTFKPATGQLSSTNPNVQNAPARGTRFSSEGYKQLAKDFRKIVCANSGKLILSADWSSFHALTLAFEAEDAVYMRLVRLDVHSYIAAWLLNDELPFKIINLKMKQPARMTNEEWKGEIEKGEEAIERFKTLSRWLELTDDKLKEHLNWIKNNYEFTRNSQAKPAILGMGFGMEIAKFYKLNRYSFQSKAQPQKILDLIRKLFPKTFIDFPENIKKLASDQTYLISRYGYIRRFYDVHDWRIIPNYRAPKTGELVVKGKDGRYWCRRSGQDANNAIAFLPANDAFGKKKESMRDLAETGANKLYGLINEIHDDLTFEIEEGKVEEGGLILKQVMESPARFLKNSVAPDGLVCKIELKVGRNWAAYHKNTNPNGMKDLKL